MKIYSSVFSLGFAIFGHKKIGIFIPIFILKIICSYIISAFEHFTLVLIVYGNFVSFPLSSFQLNDTKYSTSSLGTNPEAVFVILSLSTFKSFTSLFSA